MIYCIALLIVCVNNFKELQVHSESDIIVIFTVSYTQTAAGLQVCLTLIATTCNATAAVPHTTYQNNSGVALEDIGEGDDAGLTSLLVANRLILLKVGLE